MVMLAVLAATTTPPFAAPNSLTCALGPPWQGVSPSASPSPSPFLFLSRVLGLSFKSQFTGLTGCLASPSSLLWPKKQRECKRKAGPSSICAKFELKPPPYPLDALEPHMSKETLEYHWGKHHRGYVDNLNKQIKGNELDELSLEDIILATHNNGDLLPPFNNAAQIWNHDFFWESMKPGGSGRPSGELLELINRDFGSFERFIDDISKENRLDVENAVNPNPLYEDKRLVVVKSPNAVNPLTWDYSPLLTIDVWEHAYYLDFQNRRADYVSIFLEKLVSWEAVSFRLEIAKARAVEREEEEEKRKREEEEKSSDGEVAEIYVDNKSDDSEAE